MQAHILTALLATTLIVGCSSKPDESEKSARKAARAEKDEKKLTAPIQMRRHTVGQHEILSLTVPFSSYGMVEHQTCFVWRDAEYRTATLQCAAPPAIDLD